MQQHVNADVTKGKHLVEAYGKVMVTYGYMDYAKHL